MKPLSPAERRGLRAAAQVACALSLLGASAEIARGDDGSPQPPAGSSLDRAADVLRLRGSGGRCFPTWGPPAPPACDEALLAALLAEVA